MPPRGRYLAYEVGQLAGVPGHTIGQWARRGYIRSSHPGRNPRVYSYQDVAEAMVVHELLLSDISHRDIKRAIANLRAEYGDWPLTQAKLGTFEGALIARHGSAAYDIGKRGWQQIVEPENLEAIAVQLNYGGWALRKVPDIRHIEVSPFRLSGRPTIRGRRVPAAKVGRLAESDMGVIVLRTDYALTTDEIDNALRWLRATQELSEAA